MRDGPWRISVRESIRAMRLWYRDGRPTETATAGGRALDGAENSRRSVALDGVRGRSCDGTTRLSIERERRRDAFSAESALGGAPPLLVAASVTSEAHARGDRLDSGTSATLVRSRTRERKDAGREEGSCCLSPKALAGTSELEDEE
jgi:hypothetical protein